MHEDLERILPEFQDALAKAIGATPEVRAVVRQIEKRGFSLFILIDRDRDRRGADAKPETVEEISGAAPVFRIDGEDLVFLRSIGIDPTRKAGRRK